MSLNQILGDFKYVAAFVAALALGLYVTPVVRTAAIRYGVVDRPDGKLKQHAQPVAYLGGVAIYLAFLFSVALTYEFTKEVLGLMLAASIVVMLGLFDDLKVLTPSAKLLGQFIAVLVLMKAGIMIRLTFIPDWMAVLLTVLWLVGVTNALNLIDVSDGLAGGVACIAGMFLYVVSIWNENTNIAMLTLALVGATCAFLVFNRPPATIYLGDTGSMFLGFMLGALAMSGHYTFNHRVASIAPVVLLGVPIFDTFYVMGVRAARGIPLMQGSPDHFAVRLRRNGWTASAIATIAYLAASMLGGSALVICLVPENAAVAILVAVAGVALLVILGLWRLGRGPNHPPRTTDVEPQER